MAKRLTPNQKQFEKEVKRLNRLLTISIKKGIVFEESPIPEKPKRITYKRLSAIHNITLSDLQSKGYVYDEFENLVPYVPTVKSRKRKALPRPPKKEKTQITYPSAIYFEQGKSEDFTEIPEDEFNFPEEPAQGWLTVLNNLTSILSSGMNTNICNYLLDMLQDEINDADDFNDDPNETGESIVGKRLMQAEERVIELATDVSYETSETEILKQKAYDLAVLITDNSVSGMRAEDIERLAYEDIPYAKRY